MPARFTPTLGSADIRRRVPRSFSLYCRVPPAVRAVPVSPRGSSNRKVLLPGPGQLSRHRDAVDTRANASMAIGTGGPGTGDGSFFGLPSCSILSAVL